MAIDTKHGDLQSLRIDRSHRNDSEGEPPAWARRYIVGGIAVVVLLGIAAMAYRVFAPAPAEVEVVRAATEGGGDVGGVVLSAGGYIVAHHKINVNSKVTGRVRWIGVEKGDKVKEDQILVRLEDDEFRAQYQQAQGTVANARAYLQELQNGSRPEEVQQAQHNLDEARATAANDKITLDRTRDLFGQGVVSKQALDDAAAKYEADQQRVNSVQQTFTLSKLGPRAEEIARAKGALMQSEGMAAFAKSQLDATLVRAPVSGTILERKVEKGELITAQFASGAEGGPQGSVVALADLNDLQVELDIAQNDFSRLKARQKGIVTVDAFPNLKWEGAIAEMSPEANRQKATVQVKVRIDKPDEHLRPDMNATVKFLADDEKSASQEPSGAVVPSSAVRDRDGKKVVFIIRDNKAVMKQVRILEQRSNGYLIDGPINGENVITNAPENLKDGQSIKIKGQSS
ncbi:MAG TPA: efflux RND transporter periplasmic adaptor subunit [Terriglobales bacterium]|nr:efflux RND transporter periplasmic adaptor subunit [Terriglobales bacterium]